MIDDFKDFNNEKQQDSTSLFGLIKKCIESVTEGETVHNRIDFNNNELDEFIDSLNSNQLSKIMKFFETMPRLRHVVKVTNPKTKVESEVVIETPKGKVTIENDFVLALTGYKPDLTFLEKIGIQLSVDELKTPSYNPETMETNIKGLFLAGVVCGGMQTHKWFIENSRVHANMIVDYITSK